MAAGNAIIPANLGEGGAHLTGFGRGGGLIKYLRSVVDDLRDIRDNYNAHTHGGATTAPDAVTPPEVVTIGTTFSDE